MTTDEKKIDNPKCLGYLKEDELEIAWGAIIPRKPRLPFQKVSFGATQSSCVKRLCQVVFVRLGAQIRFVFTSLPSLFTLEACGQGSE